MAKDQGVNLQTARSVGRPARVQPPKSAPSAKAAAPVEATPRKRTSIVQFLREVRTEARKTTWTRWRETWIISVMVFMMVAVTALFFSLVDGVLNFLMQQFLRLAS